jgi:hypothetical protein
MMSGLWGNAKEAHIVVPDAGFRSNGLLTRRGNIGIIAPCHPDDILLVGIYPGHHPRTEQSRIMRRMWVFP